MVLLWWGGGEGGCRVRGVTLCRLGLLPVVPVHIDGRYAYEVDAADVAPQNALHRPLPVPYEHVQRRKKEPHVAHQPVELERVGKAYAEHCQPGRVLGHGVQHQGEGQVGYVAHDARSSFSVVLRLRELQIASFARATLAGSRAGVAGDNSKVSGVGAHGGGSAAVGSVGHELCVAVARLEVYAAALKFGLHDSFDDAAQTASLAVSVSPEVGPHDEEGEGP